MALQGYLRLQCASRHGFASPILGSGHRPFHISNIIQSRKPKDGKLPGAGVKLSESEPPQATINPSDSESSIGRKQPPSGNKQLQTIQPTHIQPRRTEVPARVVPKPQVSPGVPLSPKDRLRIEYSTRQPPKPVKKPGEAGHVALEHY